MIKPRESVRRIAEDTSHLEQPQTEEDIIREVAEEEGMTYEEVEEMWNVFKDEANNLRDSRNATKPKRNNKKVKNKRKQAKKSRKRNR